MKKIKLVKVRRNRLIVVFIDDSTVSQKLEKRMLNPLKRLGF